MPNQRRLWTHDLGAIAVPLLAAMVFLAHPVPMQQTKQTLAVQLGYCLHLIQQSASSLSIRFHVPLPHPLQVLPALVYRHRNLIRHSPSVSLSFKGKRPALVAFCLDECVSLSANEKGGTMFLQAIE
jgi:hypothetical protein